MTLGLSASERRELVPEHETDDEALPGELYYNTTDQSFKYKDAGGTIRVASAGDVESLSTSGAAGTIPVSQGSSALAMEAAQVAQFDDETTERGSTSGVQYTDVMAFPVPLYISEMKVKSGGDVASWDATEIQTDIDAGAWTDITVSAALDTYATIDRYCSRIRVTWTADAGFASGAGPNCRLKAAVFTP